MNTGILLSGFPPEYNLILKAVVIIVILLAQSFSSAGGWHFLKTELRTQRVKRQ
jgi:ribose/xylose/arabinose/galactoside ABC-type transport system permease subunit